MIAVKQLVKAKQIESSQTDQYTAVNCVAMVDNCTVTNTSTSNVSFSINIVQTSGAAGDSNLIIKNKVLAPAETYRCPEMIGKVISDGATISAVASAATSLTLDIAGREKT